MSMKNKDSFERTLRRAARISLITGKIKLGDWVNIQSILLKPVRTTTDGVEVNLVDELAEDILQSAVSANKITIADGYQGDLIQVEAIDWDSLFTYIKELLPNLATFIQDLMDLFKKKSEEV